MTPRDVVVVGGSTAGATTVRELRRRGHTGRLTLVDPEDGCNRPPLSKTFLAGDPPDASVLMDHTALDVHHVRAVATGLDTTTRVVTASDGSTHPYDALVVATGSRARRLASPGQQGELVLRSLADARELRRRLAPGTTVVVVGSGFLGMEVATAAARAGAYVTVVDPDPPLVRLTGEHLAHVFTRRAADMGIEFRRSSATLLGDPVTGVRLADGQELTADLVVSCVGDVPVTDWLDGTGLATPAGVLIDEAARTGAVGVFAAGDVAAVRSGATTRRAPFWANAVTQGRVVAASLLGQTVDDPVLDDYFWTEVAGLSLKAVGRLPADGPPRVLEDAGNGTGVLAWDGPTVVALGTRRPVPRLRAIARDLATLTP